MNSSVAKKWLMALSGLFLCSFLVVHLSGNLLLLKSDGGTLFNQYAHFMSTNLWIRTAELILALGFVGHIVLGLVLSFHAYRCRPHRYAVSPGNQTSSSASRWMWITGSLVLVFLIIHLKNFFYVLRFGQTNATPYEIVRNAFENPVYCGFYLLSFVILGWHLKHGFTSAFQSLGVRHPKLSPVLSFIGVCFWAVIPALFSVIPLTFLVRHLWQ